MVLLARSAEKLALLGDELGAQTQVYDASKADELERMVGSFGPIRGIVNCVGSILLKPVHLTSERVDCVVFRCGGEGWYYRADTGSSSNLRGP